MAEVEQMPEESTDIYHTNIIDSYYPNRCDDMDKMCLHEVYSQYDYSKQEPMGAAQKYPIRNNLGWFKKRGKPAIIKTPRYSTNTDDGIESFYHGLLMLFKPWRTEEELLGPLYASYREVYEACAEELPKMVKYNEAYRHLEAAKELSKKLEALGIEAAKEGAIDDEDLDIDEDPSGDVLDAVTTADAPTIPLVNQSEVRLSESDPQHLKISICSFPAVYVQGLNSAYFRIISSQNLSE